MPEPSITLGEPTELLLAYLDKYRKTLLRKLEGLDDSALRGSVLPSGWSPLELLTHLAYMERRWLRWGFTAEPIAEPFGDEPDEADVWAVRAGQTLESLIAFLREQAAYTRHIAEHAELDQRAAVGGRFASTDKCPTLGWILCHVLQEYARHVGQLDVARELIDGSVGE